METPNITKTAQGLDQASKGQSSQGLIVQGYCNSVIQQSFVKLSGIKGLAQFETQINDGLIVAKGHATDYNINIQPLILGTLNDMSLYFNMYNAVATTLASNTNEKDWLRALHTMKDKATQYETNANGVVRKLLVLNTDLGTDSAAFGRIVFDLNATVEGDGGILDGYTTSLADLQGKIDGCIAGMALSGLAIIGGSILMAIGAIGEVFTGGAATAVIAGGFALLLVGVGGEAGSAITFKMLSDQRNDILVEQARLKDEVKLAAGLSLGYGSLNTQAKAAMTAATQMGNAWGLLKGDLGNLVTSLEGGISNTDIIREIMLTTANSTIKDVLGGISNVNRQMAGVQVRTAPQGQRIGDFAVQLEKEYAMAA